MTGKETITRTFAQCESVNCRHRWHPRKITVRRGVVVYPKICPKCKCEDWNVPRVRKASKSKRRAKGKRNGTTNGQKK